MNRGEMEFRERAATAALTGLCAGNAGVNALNAAALSADALVEQKKQGE